MEIIVPAAGASSRFPNTRPKYLLYDYKGDLMLKNAVKPFLERGHKITVGILEEHNYEFSVKQILSKELPDVEVISLMNKTNGPAHTIYELMMKIHIKDKEFFIKDCDGFFGHELISGKNYVCTSKISHHNNLKNLSGKSFVQTNDNNIITNIMEKSVISDTFSVGGYKFNSSIDFMRSFEKLIKMTRKEIYVSHIVQDLLLMDVFESVVVNNYVDVGTLEHWLEYNDVPTIFCDIDGTLIRAQSRYGKDNYDMEPLVLMKNYNKLLQLRNRGCQIIFTTSRPKQFEQQTRKFLNKLGFGECLLLMGLNNSRRILINDYNEANPFPRASSINIRRDSDNLEDFI